MSRLVLSKHGASTSFVLRWTENDDNSRRQRVTQAGFRSQPPATRTDVENVEDWWTRWLICKGQHLVLAAGRTMNEMLRFPHRHRRPNHGTSVNFLSLSQNPRTANYNQQRCCCCGYCLINTTKWKLTAGQDAQTSITLTQVSACQCKYHQGTVYREIYGATDYTKYNYGFTLFLNLTRYRCL